MNQLATGSEGREPYPTSHVSRREPIGRLYSIQSTARLIQKAKQRHHRVIRIETGALRNACPLQARMCRWDKPTGRKSPDLRWTQVNIRSESARTLTPPGCSDFRSLTVFDNQ